jgi:hypothetical protein
MPAVLLSTHRKKEDFAEEARSYCSTVIQWEMKEYLSK